MLDQLRQGAQGWVSKVLMILLVLSFAVWGIGGFEGYGAGTVATVGDAEVSVQEFGRAYDQMQRNAQQTGQQANADLVLSQLLHSAALEDEAVDHGLGVSEQRIGREIAANPAFQGIAGFDSNRFALVLQDAGINRDEFVREVRRDLVRDQLAESLGAGLEAPKPIVEAIYRLQNEERTVSYIVVDESAVEPVAEPGDATLQAWFEESRQTFAAPEFRKVALLVLDPVKLANPAALTDEEVAAEYEENKADFTTAEQRRIEQIRFDTPEAAQEALEAIEGGKDFGAVATERGFTPQDIDLGMKPKTEIIDSAIAETAFTAAPNTPVAVTEGAMQPSVIRVTEVKAGSVTPLAEAAPKLREEMATRIATERIHELYDQVEDERAGGATLEEVAKNLSLPYRVIEGISLDGATPDDKTISDIPNQAEVLGEAFESDIGVENSPIRAVGDAWVFFDVLDIVEARDRTLEEVREKAREAWKAAELESRISAKTEALAARLSAGEPIARLAAEIRKPVQTVEKVKRDGQVAGLTPNAVSQAFAGPEGHVANAEGEGANRILLKVDKVNAPAFFAEAEGVNVIEQGLTQALTTDVLSTYNRQLLQLRTTSVNNAVLQQLTGQTQPQTQ